MSPHSCLRADVYVSHQPKRVLESCWIDAAGDLEIYIQQGGARHCACTSASVIEVGRDGELRRIRFNNWLRSAMILPAGIVGRMYDALAQFWRLLRDPRHQLHLRLTRSDLITYDNKRILHGRSAFDPSSGERHLQGCYLNEEDLDSTLRLIERTVD